MDRFAARYGAGPAHLLAVLGCLALAGYAVSFVAGDPAAPRMLAWFLVAVLAHDLLLHPLYAGADRLLGGLVARLPRPRVALLNHLRVPLLGAGLTLLLFLPGIVGHGADAHLAATGLDQSPYLGRWLALVAALFATSALVYGVRVLVALGRERRGRVGRAAQP